MIRSGMALAEGWGELPGLTGAGELGELLGLTGAAIFPFGIMSFGTCRDAHFLNFHTSTLCVKTRMENSCKAIIYGDDGCMRTTFAGRTDETIWRMQAPYIVLPLRRWPRYACHE